MPILSKHWFSVLSDLLVNLAAASFSAAFITPGISSGSSQREIITLLLYTGFGIVGLVLATDLRQSYV